MEELFNFLGDYWNHTSGVDYESEERKHPYVGRRIIITSPDYENLYGHMYTITRAYERSDGIRVRIDVINDEYHATITLKSSEYRLL